MSSSKIDEPQLIAKGITSITEATNSVKQTVNSNLDKVHSMFSRLEFDLSKSQEEVREHLENIASELGVLEDFIVEGRFEQRQQPFDGTMLRRCSGPFESGVDMFPEPRPDYRSEHEDTICREHQQYLCAQDGEGLPDLQPTTGLLANTHNNLENVQNTTKDRFTSVFRQFETLEEKAREDIRKQQRKLKGIQRSLWELQDRAKFLYEMRSEHSRPADGKSD